MKAQIRGRAVDLDLTSGQQELAARLETQGLLGNRVENLAAAALRYAEEATKDLQLKLVPQDQWPGIVLCQKHYSAEGTAWLMLRRVEQGWRFDSALID